jgi:hypothetical protein
MSVRLCACSARLYRSYGIQAHILDDFFGTQLLKAEDEPSDYDELGTDAYVDLTPQFKTHRNESRPWVLINP